MESLTSAQELKALVKSLYLFSNIKKYFQYNEYIHIQYLQRLCFKYAENLSRHFI